MADPAMPGPGAQPEGRARPHDWPSASYHHSAAGYGDPDPDRASDPDRADLLAWAADQPERPATADFTIAEPARPNDESSAAQGLGPDDLEALLNLTRRDATDLHQIEPGPALGTDVIDYHADSNAVPDRPSPAAQVTPARRTNVLAMVAVCAGVLFPPAGIVCGHLAQKQIRRTREEGEGLAMAGLVLGYALSTALLVGCCGLAMFNLFSHGFGH